MASLALPETRWHLDRNWHRLNWLVRERGDLPRLEQHNLPVGDRPLDVLGTSLVSLNPPSEFSDPDRGIFVDGAFRSCSTYGF